MSEHDILTTCEAAEFLRISKTNLEHQRLLGSGPPYARMGRLIRYRRSTLEKWLAELEQRNGGTK